MGICGFTARWKWNGSSKKQVLAAVPLELDPAPDFDLLDISGPLHLSVPNRFFDCNLQKLTLEHLRKKEKRKKIIERLKSSL